MTDGGTFLLYAYGMYKLGSCGLESIEYSGVGDSGTFCGKVPGGALFCSGSTCYRYDDYDESFKKMPSLNESSFIIMLLFHFHGSSFIFQVSNGCKT